MTKRVNKTQRSLSVPSIEIKRDVEFDEMMSTSLKQARNGEGELSSRVFDDILHEINNIEK